MSIIGNNMLAGASGNQGHEIERSLRFEGGDTAYLNRTPSSNGNLTTHTYACWFKRSKSASDTGLQVLLSAGNTAGITRIIFNTSEQLKIMNDPTGSSGWTGHLRSTQKFRDFSAWYHICCVFDTSNSTASERLRMYVNGERVTDLSTETYPAQNDNSALNSTEQHFIGRYTASTQENYFYGYLAEAHFIDGQALDASYFGETDSATGAWIPKQYSGTYGTNGFYLKFADNSGVTATTLGKDSSGNGNNFTPNNFSVTAGAGNDSLEDTPTNNWCTWNPLAKDGGTTYSNGNLDISSDNYGNNTATFFLTSGKWYWEGKGSGYVAAICGRAGQNATGSISTAGSNSIGYWQAGPVYWDGGNNSGTTSYTSSDVIGTALDMDNGIVYFYKNGSLTYTITFGSGTVPDLSDGVFPCYNNGASTGTKTVTHNFGQRAFDYTPPTGYKALNTANLPEPTIKNGTEYFNTVLWTGNSSTQAITGVGFQPDFVWGKARSVGYAHNLFDVVRGATKSLVSSSTAAEITVSGLTSFDSDGFTLGSNLDLNLTTHTYVAWNWDAGSNSSKTFTVKVVSDSGNKYRFDDFGTSAVTLDLEEGSTYVFDQSDSSNSGHPLRFSTTSDGTHGSGSEYTTGVTTTGTPGSAGAKTTIVVAASAPTLYYYCSVHSGMGGQANTNDTAGASNFAGSTQATVRVNADAGFSIVEYTGNSTAGATVGHGLGVAPSFIVIKGRGFADNWACFHKSTGNTYKTRLNSSSGQLGPHVNYWNNTDPTSTVFTVGIDNELNKNAETHIAYCFAEVEGYSKFGSYEGNGSSEGTFIALSFKPSFFMLKDIDRDNTRWIIMDNVRDSYNVAYHVLSPSSAVAEDTSETYWLADFVSNGVKLRYGADNEFNKSGDTYIYMAFAETPFKYANAR